MAFLAGQESERLAVAEPRHPEPDVFIDLQRVRGDDVNAVKPRWAAVRRRRVYSPAFGRYGPHSASVFGSFQI